MIEIIIALGLLAVLALMVSSLLFKAGQHNKQIEGRGDAWDFTQGIGLTLKTKTLPTATPGP